MTKVRSPGSVARRYSDVMTSAMPVVYPHGRAEPTTDDPSSGLRPGCRLDEGLLEALRAAVPGGILTAAEDLIAYGFDGTFYERTPPLVILPATTAEVSAVHRIATQRRVALTPRAMGSGLSGGAVPLDGSIVLGVARMDRILEIDEVDRVAVVQAGVINAKLQAEVETARAVLPARSVEPQAERDRRQRRRERGRRALPEVRRDRRLRARARSRAARRHRDSHRRPHGEERHRLRLAALFTGAEGTLGTITEITLRLLSKPKFARAALAVFDRIEDAAEATTAVMASGVLPAAIELVDNFTMRCVEENSPIGLPLDADAILIFGVDGNYEAVLADELGDDRPHRARARRARRDASPRTTRTPRGCGRRAARSRPRSRGGARTSSARTCASRRARSPR